MMRVTTEIRASIKKCAKIEDKSMIEYLHDKYVKTPYQPAKYTESIQAFSNELKGMEMGDKVQLVLDKMKEMKLSSVHKNRALDGNFWRAGKALGLSRPTIEKYWGWFYENHVRGV